MTPSTFCATRIARAGSSAPILFECLRPRGCGASKGITCATGRAVTLGQRAVEPELTPAQLAGLRYCATPAGFARPQTITAGAPTQATLRLLHERGLITSASRLGELTAAGREALASAPAPSRSGQPLASAGGVP